jgi:hypothetical protein
MEERGFRPRQGGDQSRDKTDGRRVGDEERAAIEEERRDRRPERTKSPIA